MQLSQELVRTKSKPRNTEPNIDLKQGQSLNQKRLETEKEANQN